MQGNFETQKLDGTVSNRGKVSHPEWGMQVTRSPKDSLDTYTGRICRKGKLWNPKAELATHKRTILVPRPNYMTRRYRSFRDERDINPERKSGTEPYALSKKQRESSTVQLPLKNSSAGSVNRKPISETSQWNTLNERSKETTSVTQYKHESSGRLSLSFSKVI